MRFIDLSATIANTPEGTPEYSKTEIIYSDHAQGAQQARALGIMPHFFRDGEGWATERITCLETHGTTHVDAPWHYNSRIRGAKAQTIDELPLEWFFGNGIRLDFSHKADGDAVSAADIEKELDRMGYRLQPLDIVLIYTGRDIYQNSPDYFFKGCGVTAEATRLLYDAGIRVTGIDAWGWDRPLHLQAQEVMDTHQTGRFWTAHQAGLPYSHMERLVNLGALPATGFQIACFPLKIARASAAPARVVAILP
ncbi:MAG TPA: cyclase family protein [Smithellaceae bacterium]|nr:cyclase family protein [Smithellaceae bacterium]